MNSSFTGNSKLPQYFIFSYGRGNVEIPIDVNLALQRSKFFIENILGEGKYTNIIYKDGKMNMEFGNPTLAIQDFMYETFWPIPFYSFRTNTKYSEFDYLGALTAAYDLNSQVMLDNIIYKLQQEPDSLIDSVINIFFELEKIDISQYINKDKKEHTAKNIPLSRYIKTLQVNGFNV